MNFIKQISIKMRIIFLGCIAVFAILFLVVSPQRNEPEMPTVKIEKLVGSSFIDTYKNTVDSILVDVRTPEEFAVGHIEGALNIDFEDKNFIAEIKKLDTQKSYFIYCRSGNRSGQAINLMLKNGFVSLYELAGGINASQNKISLITNSSTTEYVVDDGDMIDGEQLISSFAMNELNTKEIQGLIQMREEEKLAHDVYVTLGTVWGNKIFSNIARSEQTHTSAIKTLLDRYAVNDPVLNTATVGEFTSPELQALYNELVEKGKKSMLDALYVGATIEDLDIHDLDVLMKETDKEDILVTYRNLQKGSRNHLRAFVKNLNDSYAPQYISEESYSTIINGSQERGRI